MGSVPDDARSPDAPPVDRLHRQPGDGWVTCGDHRHWGLHGAGGLFLARGVRGTPVTHVALQHRAVWSDQGGTWGIPGGAVATGESATAGALREAEEEAGIDPADVDVVGTHVLDHGPWSYTTVVGRERAGAHVEPRATDAEGIEVRWVALDELDGLVLLPAFADALDALLALAQEPADQP